MLRLLDNTPMFEKPVPIKDKFNEIHDSYIRDVELLLLALAEKTEQCIIGWHGELGQGDVLTYDLITINGTATEVPFRIVTHPEIFTQLFFEGSGVTVGRDAPKSWHEVLARLMSAVKVSVQLRTRERFLKSAAELMADL